MARYIDAEELINNLNKFAPESFNALINSLILKQPTADVQEVKHGKWIDEQLDKFRKWKSTCSVCGWNGISNYDSYVDIYDFEYCPYCGAKMDKE